jgi:hypothetical protein
VIFVVLFQGGKLYFMEHIRDTPGTWIYYKQRLASLTGYWPFFYGCSIDKDLGEEILNSKLFSRVDLEKLYLAPEMFSYLSPHTIGIALK